MKKFKVGDMIVLNKTIDAVIWLVLETDGKFLLGVKDMSKDALPLNAQRLQWIDVSLARKPTHAQKRNLIAA